MHIGIYSKNTDYGPRLHDLAQACEARGLESLWTGEHTHIPAGVRARLEDVPYFQREIFHMPDPFLSLTAAAAVTTTLKLGVAVCLVAEREPIALAKIVATLDLLSNGRLLFGVGSGWIAEEMETLGTPWARRWEVLEDRIAAMKAIWTQEEASYQGPFVKFEQIVSYPKPVQKPYPPILLGAGTAQARRRVARYCDGWCPIDIPMEDLPAALDDLRQQALAAGRDPATISVTMFTWDALTEERVQRYQELGLERVVVVCPLEDPFPFLDQTARLAASVQ